MTKRSKCTVVEEIFQLEGFDVRFLPSDPDDLRPFEKYPYERAANATWTLKKWRTTRFAPNYPDLDVEFLDVTCEPVNGEALFETVRATYEYTTPWRSETDPDSQLRLAVPEVPSGNGCGR